jgi:hypothetical protein
MKDRLVVVGSENTPAAHHLRRKSMATKWTPDAAARRVVKGFDARLRERGDQWLVKAGGKTVASVMPRKGFVRIDLKVAVPRKDTPTGVVYVTAARTSKSWPGGGLCFGEGQEEDARTILEAAVARPPTKREAP